MPRFCSQRGATWQLLKAQSEWVLKCALKLLSGVNAWSYWLHLYVFLQSEFSNVVSNGMPDLMHSCIGCICMICLQSEFSSEAPNKTFEKLQNRIGYICMIFLWSEFSNVPSKRLYVQMQSCICCTHFPFLFVPSLYHHFGFRKQKWQFWREVVDCFTHIVRHQIWLKLLLSKV